jgi:hypothetical protein
MSFGNLGTDWQKAADPKDFSLNTPEKLKKLKIEMSANMAAFVYYNAGNRVVYTRKTSTPTSADFLIDCSSDFMHVVPNGAKFRAFKNGQSDPVGFVSVNVVTRALSLLDTGNPDAPVTHAGLTYEHVDTHMSKDVYARLDRNALRALAAGRILTDGNFNAYETSMQKGVIPSGSTGADGIKFDHSEWVIKLTISIATAQGIDNSLSPMATFVQVGEKIFLNFNQLTYRH